MSSVDVYCSFVLPLIKEAGEEIKNACDIKIETKDDDFDLVTEYDKRVEEKLIKKLKNKYPNHKFIGEEESAMSGKIATLTDDPTWIIDPIDGTSNFVRHFPITCISVGLTINKEQVLGIIYNPYMNELYIAKKGGGAYLNGNRILTNNCKDISKSVLNYELSLARNEKHREMYLRRFSKLITTIQGIRSLGCAALSLCYVARGISDAYQCDGLYPWDAAAGVLILREAGGFVCSSNGDEFDLMNPNFIATASKELAEQYVALEKEADGH